jgi:hypothetical protein
MWNNRGWDTSALPNKHGKTFSSWAGAYVNSAGGERKMGRNDPCPCGSGKKFKTCCLGKDGGEESSPVPVRTPNSPKPKRSVAEKSTE